MFFYNGGNHHLKDCVKLANDLTYNEKFLGTISDSTFDMSTCEGDRIAENIRNGNKITESFLFGGEYYDETFDDNPLIVKTYYPKWRWSSALGYFSPSKPDYIYLNAFRLNRTKGSVVSSLIHEMIHYLDHIDTEHSFGHGKNDPTGKENTAPYYIDNLAQEIIDGKIDFNNTDNSRIYVYIPWYKRFWNYVF